MVHKIRVILEAEQDVFRDIEIGIDQKLIDLHQGIKKAFDLEGDEMASFYLSNDQWFQGSEIPLENLSEEGDAERMAEISVEQVIPQKGNKMIYVYDFLNLWTFFVEVVETDVISVNDNLPAVVFSYGIRPDEAPENELLGNFDEDGFADDDFEDLNDDYGDFDEQEYW